MCQTHAPVGTGTKEKVRPAASSPTTLTNRAQAPALEKPKSAPQPAPRIEQKAPVVPPPLVGKKSAESVRPSGSTPSNLKPRSQPVGPAPATKSPAPLPPSGKIERVEKESKPMEELSAELAALARKETPPVKITLSEHRTNPSVPKPAASANKAPEKTEAMPATKPSVNQPSDIAPVAPPATKSVWGTSKLVQWMSSLRKEPVNTTPPPSPAAEVKPVDTGALRRQAQLDILKQKLSSGKSEHDKVAGADKKVKQGVVTKVMVDITAQLLELDPSYEAKLGDTSLNALENGEYRAQMCHKVRAILDQLKFPIQGRPDFLKS